LFRGRCLGDEIVDFAAECALAAVGPPG
jgi:hypothetical protein